MNSSVGQRLRAYVELARPANVITAFADILAGYAASGAFAIAFPRALGDQFVVQYVSPGLISDLFWLLAATAGLYAGGVVLNDYFDADVDALERPERPIPSGRATRGGAAGFGALLLAGGIGAAGFVSLTALFVAAAVAACAVVYDAVGKHHALLGPINMGLCRGGNLLLGMTAIPIMLGELWFLALIPVAYIGAVTAVSRGEVHGGRADTGLLAIVLVGLVTGMLFLLEINPDFRLSQAAPFIAVFAALVFPAVIRAARDPSPSAIRTAVRRGVLSLVVLNASIAAGFAGWIVGLIVLALLPVSLGLARLFAVT